MFDNEKSFEFLNNFSRNPPNGFSVLSPPTSRLKRMETSAHRLEMSLIKIIFCVSRFSSHSHRIYIKSSAHSKIDDANVKTITRKLNWRSNKWKKNFVFRPASQIFMFFLINLTTFNYDFELFRQNNLDHLFSDKRVKFL